MSTMSLTRFIDAQNPIFDQVMKELAQGRKTSHWMWYIFPQLKGLGSSAMSQYYAITDQKEAIAYLHHPTLAARLLQCTELLLQHTHRPIDHILGHIDSIKLKSSMTLFEYVASAAELSFETQKSHFTQILTVYFDQQRDQKTLQLLQGS